MTTIRGIASARIGDLLATAQDEDAAVAALGECVDRIQHARPAQASLVQCDVADLRAALPARRARHERARR